ncbi:MAG: protein-disulfide reductase DsbD [Legionellaceae bacterium]
MTLCLRLFFILFSLHTYANPLPAEAIIQLYPSILNAHTLNLKFQIEPGYFLYQDKLHITVENNHHLNLSELKLPKAHETLQKNDHAYAVYRSKLTLPVELIIKNPGKTILKIDYQGCADSGFCYAPQTRKLILKSNAQLHLDAVDWFEKKQERSVVFHGHWIITLFTFFGLGLLLAFTPCVLPMIPVLSSIILGHRHLTPGKATLLSLTYVLSMSFTYALVGGVIASMGHNLQHIMQSPFVLITFSSVFFILALSMFNLYEFKLPLKFQAHFAKLSYQQAAGHYLGAAIMGCLSTLILSPCVTPPLLGVLSYIAQKGNIFLGLSALFMLGLGMGFPLLLVGASLGKWLPATGPWMNIIKKIIGCLMIGVAIALLSRLFPSEPFNPLMVIVKSPLEANQAQQDARHAQKPVLLDFYADWCVSCKTMEKTVLTDPAVQNSLTNYVIIKADITQNTPETRALMQQYHIIAPPTLLFFDKEGHEIKEKRHLGDIDSETLLHSL